MATIEGMTTTSNTGSPLVTYSRAKRAKRKAPGQDVENAADARRPGDAAEDVADGASNPNLRRKAQLAKTLKAMTKK